MRRLAILLVVVLIAGCSSNGHKITPPAPTTTTTEAPATVTSAAPTTTNTPTTTSSSVPGASLTVVEFTGPPSPVECNAQTTLVELQWEITGATKTVLSIDGSPFATFTGGKHQGLEPLQCDGKPHVYTVRGTSAKGVGTKSLTLTTKPPS
jgi:hypothetical protein